MTRLFRAAFAGLLMTFAPMAAVAQGAGTFARLMGEWRAEGQSFGQPSKSRMVWRSVLDGKAVQIDYEIALSGPKGAQRFYGIGHFVTTDGAAYRGYWVDNGPELFPIEGTISGDAYTSIWGVAGQKRGKTMYRIAGPGQIEVVDWIEQKDGSWKEFNRAMFTRTT